MDKKDKAICWLVFDEKKRLVSIYRTKEEAKRLSLNGDIIRKGTAQLL